jgi:hypothetical protein
LGERAYTKFTVTTEPLPIDAREGRRCARLATNWLPHGSREQAQAKRGSSGMWDPIVFYGPWVLWRITNAAHYMLTRHACEEGDIVTMVTFEPILVGGYQRDAQTARAFEILIDRAVKEARQVAADR